ncbi:Protein of unknown function DUF4228 [Macleaya cordata]|uniref:Uncharacterized protein n=1 Tax=Macleaya cordata TaxID=56857 RepID=A0A200QW95_MACCD|nr:Protein of unknown function DUF4228 [Macleaya cordata]
MGNCSLKGIAGTISDPIRIMTDSGGTVEFRGPIQVRNVINNYPGYGIFREGQLSSPLFHHEQLFSSHLYYLLPVPKKETLVKKTEEVVVVKRKSDLEFGNQAVRSNSFSTRVSSAKESDLGGKNLIVEPALEVLPSLGNGVWRVKMVIDTKQLEEILSEQVNIGELIEKMREVASSSSSTSSTPRRSWRPSFSSVFKVSPAADCKVKQVLSHEDL